MKKRIIPQIGDYNKIDVLSFVKMKIRDNDEWAKHACLKIYSQQEDKEKRTHLSHGHNGVGFGRYDTPKLTKIACRIIKHQENLDDIHTLKILMPKYAAQIICLSNEKKLLKHLDMYYKPRTDKRMPF